jgi:hypothetical protein
MLERLMEEITRYTLAVRIFPNAAACLRFVRAPAVDTHEDFHEQAASVNTKKQASQLPFPLEQKYPESRPGTVKVVRSAPEGSLDGWLRFVHLNGEGMAAVLAECAA